MVIQFFLKAGSRLALFGAAAALAGCGGGSESATNTSSAGKIHADTYMVAVNNLHVSTIRTEMQ